MTTSETEIGNLIGSEKVEGTAVYGADDNEDRFNRARNDRKEQRAECRMPSSASADLGLGKDHYPLPWQSLKYDTRLAATSRGNREKLRGAPKDGDDRDWDWTNTAGNKARRL